MDLKELGIDSLPAESMTPKDASTRESYEKSLGDIVEAKEKLASTVEKVDARAEKLEATIEGYAQAKAVCSSGATDVDSSLAVVLRADLDAGGRTGNEDYGLSVEDIEKISSALSSLEAAAPEDVETKPEDLEVNPDDLGNKIDAQEDKPLDLDTSAADMETSREPDAQAAPDDTDAQVIADTEKIEARTEPDIEDGEIDVELTPSPFDEEIIEEAQGPYDGPTPVTEDDWKSAQLEHFRESIDQHMDVTDAYIRLLDNPDISDDDKLAAFDRMAGKMGFTEEMLETVYISRPEESPDVDIQTDGNTEMPGPDGTFSLKEDFLDKYAGEIPEQDFYSAFADKVKEIEDEAKDEDEDKDVDANVIERLADAFSDIEDAAISSMTYQAEHLVDLVEAICEGDWDSVGNMLMDSYFDKIEAQLSPIEHVADYLNDKFDPEWQADSEAIKESICERLEGISNDGFVDRIRDIAETLSDIFHGFDVTLAQIGESYAGRDVDRFEAEPQDIEIPEADNAVDRHINDAAPDIQTGLDMETDDFDMDMELSSQVESLRDFFADVEGITAGAESAATAEELEAAIAAV